MRRRWRRGLDLVFPEGGVAIEKATHSNRNGGWKCTSFWRERDGF